MNETEASHAESDSALEQPGFAERLHAELSKLDPLGRLEATLFLAREPLHSRKLSQLAGLEDGTKARSLVKQLNQNYDERGRSFIVKQVAGGFQMRTRPMFSDWLKKVQFAPTSVRLSGPAMETLSVVAYRQPVLKAEIEAIRGVSCGELLRQLLDRGLVKIAGRSNELGNPFMYGTTRKFLEVFGLANIDALPRGKKLRGKGLPDWSITVAEDGRVEKESSQDPDTDSDSAMNADTNADSNQPHQEIPDNSDQNPLDEHEPNSQNNVGLDTPANEFRPEDPGQE